MLVTIASHRELFFAGPLDADGIVIGASPACDIRAPIQGSITVQVKDGQIEIYQTKPNDTQRYLLKAGASKTIQGLEIRAYAGKAADDVSSANPQTQSPALSSHGMIWLERFCHSGADHDTLLNEWLHETRQVVGARAATFLRFDQFGDQIAAWDGCDLPEAELMVRTTPETIRTEILRSGAQIILPDELNVADRSSASIRIGGMRGAVGISVRFGSHTHGIAFFAYSNVIVEFTIPRENQLKQASEILALAMQVHRPNAPIQQSTGNVESDNLMLGESAALHDLYNQIRKVAPSKISVLINGETGTGKELAAREIHRRSDRSQNPLVTISGAAVPKELAEAELFGYVRGAFTGAVRDRVGVFERADGGTLFIDEVGELGLEVQAKLLRAVQEGVIQRVGDHRERQVNVRLVCATHRDLNEMVANGEFRADLLYRIAGAQIVVPSLSERLSDIPSLVQKFTAEFCTANRLPAKHWSADALRQLTEQPWPGNIRQLRNAVERIVILSDAQEITENCVSYGIRQGARPQSVRAAASATLNLEAAKDEFLKQHLTSALNQHDWNKKETAKALGIGLRSLFRYIEDLSVKR